MLLNGSYYHFVKVVCWLWWLYFNMNNWIFGFCLLFLPVIPSALKDIVFCFYFPFTSSVTRLLLGKSRQRKSHQNAQLFICIWQSRTMLSSGCFPRQEKDVLCSQFPPAAFARPLPASEPDSHLAYFGTSFPNQDWLSRSDQEFLWAGRDRSSLNNLMLSYHWF